MARYQAAAQFATLGLGAPEVIPTPTLPGDAQAITAIPIGGTVALADRIALDVDPGAAQLDVIPPPVPIPPGALLYAARYLHSLPAGARAAVGQVVVPAGAPGVASFIHALGALPDFASVVPGVGIVAGTDWAMTVMDANQFDFANWDVANPVTLNCYAHLLHSLDTPLQSSGPFDLVLAGVAPVVQAHGLGRIPDYIGIFPWSPGVAQPAGIACLSVPPDAVDVSVEGNFALADMTARCYLQATHSIQS